MLEFSLTATATFRASHFTHKRTNQSLPSMAHGIPMNSMPLCPVETVAGILGPIWRDGATALTITAAMSQTRMKEWTLMKDGNICL